MGAYSTVESMGFVMEPCYGPVSDPRETVFSVFWLVNLEPAWTAVDLKHPQR